MHESNEISPLLCYTATGFAPSKKMLRACWPGSQVQFAKYKKADYTVTETMVYNQ
jgi:hypothetical protein